MGFTSRRVAQVLGITGEYVSMLRARARAEGCAGLMRRRGRPVARQARDLGRALVGAGWRTLLAYVRSRSVTGTTGQVALCADGEDVPGCRPLVWQSTWLSPPRATW